MKRSLVLLLASGASNTFAQPPGVQTPLARVCGGGGSIVCVNKYAAVLPYHFNRSVSSNDEEYDFRNTSVSSAPAFDLLKQANFLVYNEALGMQYLGENPSYEFVFQVSKAVHEVPIWAPKQNLLFISQLAPPTGYLPQLVVDLNQDPPTLSEYLPDPPIYAPNGGTFRNGLLVFGASGGNNSIGDTEQRVSIRTVNPATNKSEVILNNYFGFYFNNIDDLALPTASYRFNPDTGATVLIEDSLQQPNGIAFAPDGNTLFISDTGAVSGSVGLEGGGQGTHFNTTGPRAIYAYDVSNNGTKISNKRASYLAQDWVPDGLKVAQNGVVVTGAGKGVDVIAPTGELIMRIQTNYTVQNIVWTGADLRTLWVMGNYGISKVQWNLTGQALT